MDIAQKKKRKEARRLFFTNECTSNAEIARRLALKPHTVAKYRKEEDWDGLRLKMDRQAAEKMAAHINNDRISLNIEHFNYYAYILAQMRETLKGTGKFAIKDLSECISIVKEAQRGQRIARGMVMDGKAEDQIRAEGQAELRHMIDVFVDAVKEHVTDEQVKEKIRRSVLEALPRQSDDGTGNGQDDGAD